MTKDEMDKADNHPARLEALADYYDGESRKQQTAIVPKQGTPIHKCPSNIKAETFKGKAMLLKAASPGELEIGPDGTLRLLATHWAVMPDYQTDDKTGEVSEFVRVVLFDATGKHFRTSSAHCPHRIAAMLDLFDPSDWVKGIPIIITTRPSKRHKGAVYHDIQLDIAGVDD